MAEAIGQAQAMAAGPPQRPRSSGHAHGASGARAAGPRSRGSAAEQLVHELGTLPPRRSRVLRPGTQRQWWTIPRPARPEESPTEVARVQEEKPTFSTAYFGTPSGLRSQTSIREAPEREALGVRGGSTRRRVRAGLGGVRLRDPQTSRKGRLAPPHLLRIETSQDVRAHGRGAVALRAANRSCKSQAASVAPRTWYRWYGMPAQRDASWMMMVGRRTCGAR